MPGIESPDILDHLLDDEIDDYCGICGFPCWNCECAGDELVLDDRCPECDARVTEGESHDPECSQA